MNKLRPGSELPEDLQKLKHVLKATLVEAFRCLKPDGRLVALGPNIKYLTATYWDFFDHYLPLTKLSVAEFMSLSVFQIEQSIGRLPSDTMSLGYRRAARKVHLFLKCPFVSRFFGRQFLVIGQKSEAGA